MSNIFTRFAPKTRPSTSSDAYSDAKHRLYAWDMKAIKFTNKVSIPYSPVYMSADERLDIEKEAANLGCEIIWR
jgi:hypothetical protein